MNKEFNVLILIIIFQFVLIVVVSAVNQPADLNEIYQKKSESKDSSAKVNNIISGGSGGSSGRLQVVPAPEAKSPVQLDKKILPDENGSQLKNSILKIKVEVQLTGKQLNYIQLIESVDDGLNIINMSKIYIANNLFDFLKLDKAFESPGLAKNYTNGIPSANFQKNNFGKDLINITNNTFFYSKNNVFEDQKINNNNLEKKGRLVYWYYFKAKEPGTYSMRTIVRTSEDYPDIDQTSKIDIKEREPRFKVDVSWPKEECSCGEKINLIYNIEYMGGSDDPYNCSIFINNNSSEYVLENGVNSYTESIRPLDLIEKKFTISYPKKGRYHLPDLYIKSAKGDSPLYKGSFSFIYMNIQDFFGRHSESVTWTILLLGIIIGQIFGAELNSFSRRIYQELKHIRLFDPFLARIRPRTRKVLKKIKKIIKYKNNFDNY